MLPTIVQDYESKEILMFAYMTKESLEKTLEEEKSLLFLQIKK